MDRERIRNAAMGKKPSDVDRRLKRRMLVYGITIVAIVGYSVMTGTWSAAPERAREPLGPVDLPVDMPPLASIDRDLLRSSVADATPTERARLEPAARVHLLRESGKLVWGDLAKLGLESVDREVLVADPSARRGDAIWVIGTLQWMATDTIDGYRTLRGIVRDAQGQPWAFLVLTEPFAIQPGDVVKVPGFFMKLYDVLQPDETFVTAPLIVGREILRSSFPIEPVTQLTADLLLDVRDYDLQTASRGLDSPEYYRLLSYMRHADDAVIFAEGDPPQEILPSEPLKQPGIWRGAIVRVTGVLLDVRRRPLGPRGENPLGEPFVWELWLSDNRAGEAGTMLVLTLEEPVGLEDGVIVEADGLFFRRYSFENLRNRPRMAAVILARRVREFVPAPDTLTPIIVKSITWLVGGLVMLFIVAQWRDRRAGLVERKRRMQRKGRHIARSTAERRASATPSDPPEPDATTDPAPPADPA